MRHLKRRAEARPDGVLRGVKSGVARFFLQVLIPLLRQGRAFGLIVAFGVCIARAQAQTLPLPPHLGAAGREDFSAYLASAQHKAFAIAPGGSWAWVADEASAALAQDKAVARCAEHTDQTCVPYALDQRRVFDEKKWATLWRLSPDKSPATGLRRGAVFPELVFKDATGQSKRLSDWRGKVVVLHFWGSWCGPCRHELPDMAAQARALGSRGVAFIPLQVRESFFDAKRWIDKQGIALTLFDSGIRDGDGSAFQIAGGGSLPDRAVAPVFPSSIVLDPSGRVVFAHHGPIERWSEYLPLLRALGAVPKS